MTIMRLCSRDLIFKKLCPCWWQICRVSIPLLFLLPLRTDIFAQDQALKSNLNTIASMEHALNQICQLKRIGYADPVK